MSTRTHPDPVDLRIVARAASTSSSPRIGVGLEHRAVVERDVVGQRPAVELGLEVVALGWRCRAGCSPPTRRAWCRSLAADDQLLGHVDQAAGEVAGVGGTQGGVDEALTGARRGDEVLEHLEAFTEVRLDRAGDHVAAGVGHQAAHAGDLADLHHVPAGARAHHHLDGVEVLCLEARPPWRPGPSVASVQMRTSCTRRSPSVMMPRRNWFSTFSASFSYCRGALLLGRRLDVVDRDGEARLAGVAVAQVLDAVERLGDSAFW